MHACRFLTQVGPSAKNLNKSFLQEFWVELYWVRVRFRVRVRVKGLGLRFGFRSRLNNCLIAFTMQVIDSYLCIKVFVNIHKMWLFNVKQNGKILKHFVKYVQEVFTIGGLFSVK